MYVIVFYCFCVVIDVFFVLLYCISCVFNRYFLCSLVAFCHPSIKPRLDWIGGRLMLWLHAGVMPKTSPVRPGHINFVVCG